MRKFEERGEEGKSEGETEPGWAAKGKADTRRAGWAGSTASSAIG